MQQVQDLIERVGKQFEALDTDLQDMTPEVRSLKTQMGVFDNELRHLRDELVGLRGEAQALHRRLDDAEKARQQREQKRAEQEKQDRLERERREKERAEERRRERLDREKERKGRRLLAIGLWIAASGTLVTTALGVISILSNQ